MKIATAYPPIECKLLNGSFIKVRPATPEDSKETVKIWNSVVREKKYTMGLNLITEAEEKEFIENLDKREAILVAVFQEKIVGYLILTIPDKICKSTLHVAEVGTFVLKEFRGFGIGHFLFLAGVKFAKINNFEKMIIKVRSSNQETLGFYKKHGFKEIGRFKKQIKIEGKYEDHVLMEKF